MVNNMKYLLVYSLIFLFSCSNINATETSLNEEHDFHTLLSNLLKVNQDKYTYLDQSGKKHPDSLKMFKELERIYIKNIEPDLEGGKFSPKRLKIIMYFSFYSYVNKSSAFQGYLASDLMPIYTDNNKIFLQILKEFPFLIPSNCNRLNAYFGHEGNNEDKKPSFIIANKKLLSQYLSDDQYNLCMRSF